MAVPKRKVSPSRRGKRRAADALAKPTYIENPIAANCIARIMSI